MKKKFYSLALMIAMFFSAIFFTACGESKAVKIEIKEDSIQTRIVVNSDEFDLSGLVLVVTYENDTTATVTKNDDMVISEIKLDKLGEQTLTVKYLGLTATTTINVVATEGDLYDIIGFEKPQFYTFYESSVRDASGKVSATSYDATKDSEFALGTYTYKVGDDNAFEFKPEVTGMNSDGDIATSIPFTSNVQVKLNGELLAEEDVAQYVAIDNINSTYDFTEKAISTTQEPKIFEITVAPEYIAEDATYSPITFKVEVVDGWNIYDATNLSRIDNSGESAAFWAEFKAQNKIGNENIKSAVIHNNIEIKRTDLPETFFHAKNTSVSGMVLDGTLKDSTSFYTRDINAGDTFTIYGNYFTISTCNEGNEAVPTVKYRDRDDGDVSHSSIFQFGGDNDGRPLDANNQGHAVINSLSLKGNAQAAAEGLTEEEIDKSKGGLNAIITSAKSTTIENCLIRAFLTHIIVTAEPTGILIDNSCTVSNSKMIDSFNTMYFAWATKSNTIINSVMKGSGGPLFMSTHVDPEVEGGLDENNNPTPNYKENGYASVTVKDSVVDAHVGGTEPWFEEYGASAMMAYFKVLSNLMKEHTQALVNKEVLDEVSCFTNSKGLINFLGVTLSDDNIMNTYPIKSEITIEDADGNKVAHQNMRDVLINSLVGTGITAMPIFKAGNSYITLDPKSIESGIPTSLAIIVTRDHVSVLTNGQVDLRTLTGGSDFALISFNDMFDIETDSGKLYEGLKTVIDALINDFFGSDYMSMFYNGPCLGATFETVHYSA